jgi:hypothetical protein
MPITGAIKEGFGLIHRNWQLVLIQFVVSVLCFLGLLVIVVLPLTVALVMLGLDVGGVEGVEDLFQNMEDPLELLSNYMAIVGIVLLCVLVYLLFAFSIVLFSLGGSAGVIGASLKEPGEGFRTDFFFSEGKRLFLPLTGFTAIVGLIYLALLLALGLLAGAGALAWEALDAGGGQMGLFLKVLITLSLAAGLFIVTFFSAVITAVGIVVMVMEGMGPLGALGETFRHLDRRPGVVWLLLVLAAGYITIQFTLALVGYPLQSIPVVGLVVALPYHVLTYVVQGYLNLVILASIFAHYRGTTSVGSTPAAGTSRGGAPRQVPPPPGSGMTQETLRQRPPETRPSPPP